MGMPRLCTSRDRAHCTPHSTDVRAEAHMPRHSPKSKAPGIVGCTSVPAGSHAPAIAVMFLSLFSSSHNGFVLFCCNLSSSFFCKAPNARGLSQTKGMTALYILLANQP